MQVFLKWWYPQITHFNRVFHYKPSILGYHHLRKHPYIILTILVVRSASWVVSGFSSKVSLHFTEFHNRKRTSFFLDKIGQQLNLEVNCMTQITGNLECHQLETGNFCNGNELSISWKGSQTESEGFGEGISNWHTRSTSQKPSTY